MFGVRCTLYSQGEKTRPHIILRTLQDTSALLLSTSVREPLCVLECPQPTMMLLVFLHAGALQLSEAIAEQLAPADPYWLAWF